MPHPTYAPCPAWCTVDHAKQDLKLTRQLERVRERTGAPADYMPDWMARWHSCTVAEIPNRHDTRPALVGLYRDDDLTNPDEDRVAVSVEHGDTLHPAAAAKLAAALLAAVELASTMPAEPVCQVCGVTVEHVIRPDSQQRYGALSGSGGWRHTTDHGGEPHTAHPAGGQH